MADSKLVVAVVLATGLLLPCWASADLQRGIRNYQEIMSGRKTVESLSREELQEVLAVYKMLQGKRGGSRGGSSRPLYEIEISHNDELFIINGEKFEAKTYCFNMEEGDEVIFLDGSPVGVCISATLLNLRTKQKCEVWCE